MAGGDNLEKTKINVFVLRTTVATLHVEQGHLRRINDLQNQQDLNATTVQLHENGEDFDQELAEKRQMRQRALDEMEHYLSEAISIHTDLSLLDYEYNEYRRLEIEHRAERLQRRFSANGRTEIFVAGLFPLPSANEDPMHRITARKAHENSTPVCDLRSAVRGAHEVQGSVAAARSSVRCAISNPAPRSMIRIAHASPKPSPSSRFAERARAKSSADQKMVNFLDGGEETEGKEFGLLSSKIDESTKPISAPRGGFRSAHGSPLPTSATRSAVSRTQESQSSQPRPQASTSSAPEASARGRYRSQYFVVAQLTNNEEPNIYTCKIADYVIKPLIDRAVNSEDIHRKTLDVANVRSASKASDADASSAKGLTYTNKMDAMRMLPASTTTHVIRQVAPWPTVAILDGFTNSATATEAVLNSMDVAITELAMSSIEKMDTAMISEDEKCFEDLKELVFINNPLVPMVSTQPIGPLFTTQEDKAIDSTLKNNRQVAPWSDAELCDTATDSDYSKLHIHCFDRAKFDTKHTLPPCQNTEYRVASGSVDDDPRDRPPDRVSDMVLFPSKKKETRFLKKFKFKPLLRNRFWKQVDQSTTSRKMGHTVNACFEKDTQWHVINVTTQAGNFGRIHAKSSKLDWKQAMIRKRPALLMGGRMLPSATGASLLQ